jgi:hypothetical protein
MDLHTGASQGNSLEIENIILQKEFLLQIFPDTISHTELPTSQQTQQEKTPATESPDSSEAYESPEPDKPVPFKSYKSESEVSDIGLKGKKPTQTTAAEERRQRNKSGNKAVAATSRKKASSKDNEDGRLRLVSPKTPYTTLWTCSSKQKMSLNKAISNVRYVTFKKGGDRIYDHFSTRNLFEKTTDETAYEKYFDFPTSGLLFEAAIKLLEMRHMIDHCANTVAAMWLKHLFCMVCVCQERLYRFREHWDSQYLQANQFVKHQIEKLEGSTHPSDEMDYAGFRRLAQTFTEKLEAINAQKKAYIDKALAVIEIDIFKTWQDTHGTADHGTGLVPYDTFLVSPLFGRPASVVNSLDYINRDSTNCFHTPGGDSTSDPGAATWMAEDKKDDPDAPNATEEEQKKAQLDADKKYKLDTLRSLFASFKGTKRMIYEDAHKIVEPIMCPQVTESQVTTRQALLAAD